jgi:hypothetical protein
VRDGDVQPEVACDGRLQLGQARSSAVRDIRATGALDVDDRLEQVRGDARRPCRTPHERTPLCDARGGREDGAVEERPAHPDRGVPLECSGGVVALGLRSLCLREAEMRGGSAANLRGRSCGDGRDSLRRGGMVVRRAEIEHARRDGQARPEQRSGLEEAMRRLRLRATDQAVVPQFMDELGHVPEGRAGSAGCLSPEWGVLPVTSHTSSARYVLSIWARCSRPE